MHGRSPRKNRQFHAISRGSGVNMVSPAGSKTQSLGCGGGTVRLNRIDQPRRREARYQVDDVNRPTASLDSLTLDAVFAVLSTVDVNVGLNLSQKRDRIGFTEN